MSDCEEPGFEIGETWYLDLDSGEWSQTPPPPNERRPPGRGVITGPRRPGTDALAVRRRLGCAEESDRPFEFEHASNV